MNQRVCSFHNSTACPCVAADNAPTFAPEPDVVTSAPAESHARITIPAPPPVTADARRAIEQVMLALEEIRTGLRSLQERARTQITPRELADDMADEIELAGVGALECELALRHMVDPLPGPAEEVRIPGTATAVYLNGRPGDRRTK